MMKKNFLKPVPKGEKKSVLTWILNFKQEYPLKKFNLKKN